MPSILNHPRTPEHPGTRGAIPAAMLVGPPAELALAVAEQGRLSVPTPALRTAWLGGRAAEPTPPAHAEGRAGFLADLLLDLLGGAGSDAIHSLSGDLP